MIYRKAAEIDWEAPSHETPDTAHALKKVLYTHSMLDKEPRIGKIPMINIGKLASGERGWFSKHHHGPTEHEKPSIGMDEYFIPIEGRAMIKIDDKEFELEPFDMLMIEAGEVHSMKNLTEKPFVYLVVGLSNGGETHTIEEAY